MLATPPESDATSRRWGRETCSVRHFVVSLSPLSNTASESFTYLPHSALALTESAFGLLPNRRFAVDQKVDAVSSLLFISAPITT